MYMIQTTGGSDHPAAHRLRQSPGETHTPVCLITFSADDELKLGRNQSVQADVNSVEPCLLELGQQPG